MTTLTIGSRDVEVSNLDKALFRDPGISKGDLIDYYRDVAEVLLPHARDRALTMYRFPNGIDREGFVQQKRPDHFPSWIGSVTVPRVGEKGGEITHVVCNDEATLVYLANQSVITLHGWLSRVPRIDRPDRLVFDLDPPGDAPFALSAEAAQRVGGLMLRIGLRPFVMTTGSKGLHVAAPLDASIGFEEARAVAREMAQLLAARHPDTLTIEQRKDKRRGRLYLDVTRNAYGQTSVLPYAVRAKRGAPVATPLDWSELERKDIGPQRFTLANVRRRLGQKHDPWADIRHHAASLERARAALRELATDDPRPDVFEARRRLRMLRDEAR
jgi:bifunctional non-homologous end joining protein LigD